MTNALNIIADSDIPYLKGVLEPYANITYKKGKDITNLDLRETEVIIIRTRTVCNEALLKNTKVKLILTATIGFEHIDLNYCEKSKICVKTAAGCNARGVLQWVAATLVNDSKEQGWSAEQKTLGVIGVGNVGSLIASYGGSWGFKVLCCDPYKDNKNYVSAEEIYSKADIITFHVPCTKTGKWPTYRMFSSKACEMIKPGALILNASRGEVLHTASIKEYLDKFRFAIDTWEGEPELDQDLLLSSCISTPHIAGYSVQGKANGTSMVVNSLAEIYDLPLKNWYPDNVKKTEIKTISWQDLCREIPKYYDIIKESEQLKSSPSDFETMRNNYTFREEFF
ncbi:MAG: 4-phosphoerythronate dehydrogenase [Rikenellaceae bacterium]